MKGLPFVFTGYGVTVRLLRTKTEILFFGGKRNGVSRLAYVKASNFSLSRAKSPFGYYSIYNFIFQQFNEKINNCDRKRESEDFSA